ncbi:MAG: hypothetical protein HYZ43_07380 [Flavobacteriia bacterium]|nr:hypothetical protein [Flavobacteriia bacterium]
MKNFLRRLKFYGFGFGIGIIFVFFFFQNRGCTWLPSNRVKNTILGRVLVTSDKDKQLFHSKGLNEDEVVAFLNDGDVDFGKSKKEGNPKVYSVTKEINGKDVELWFTIPADAYIAEVKWPKGSIFKTKNTTEGMGTMLHFPNVESIVFLDSNKRLTCQQDKLGLISPKEIVNRMKKNGKIDFSKSKLKSQPQPKQYILFTTKKGVEVAAETYWYQEHIQFTEFLLKDTLDCSEY